MRIVPVHLREANDFVKQHHRHHGKVVGYKFALGVEDEAGQLRGVAIAGRPVARMLDDGKTLEVVRLATDGVKNACSMLYAACRRTAREMGYEKIITYILETESGITLKASGWKNMGPAGGNTWNVPSRPRIDKHPIVPKTRWEAALIPQEAIDRAMKESKR